MFVLRNRTSAMNLYIVLNAIIGATFVIAAPYVDVKNDHRPILDVIAPEDELVG